MSVLSLRRPSRRSIRDFDWPVGSRISYVLWRRSWTGGFVARARGFWHHVVRGYRYETCGECGRRIEQAWVADDVLWLQVMPDSGGLLCVSCFDSKVEETGRFVRWIPTVDQDAARPQGRAAQGAANR